MNTKSIMTSSVVLLIAIGTGLNFFPAEVAAHIATSYSPDLQLILQILGALYFAFAMLNWMARGSVMGGIYNRPVVVANLAHFLIGGLALIKGLINIASLSYLVWLLAGLYSIFALLFGVIMFRNPTRVE